MKASFYLVAVAIVLLGVIYACFDNKYPWLYIIPVGYIAFAFIVGTISAIRNFRK